MKICHLTSVHSRYDSRIFLKEAVSAAEAGHEVYLLVNDNTKDEINRGVVIKSIHVKERGRLSRIFSKKIKRELLKQAVQIDADIFQFHDPELLGLGKKLRRRGYNVIYDVHEDVPRQILFKEYLPKLVRGLVSKSFEVYENQSARKYNSIVVPTPYLKNRFSKLNNSVWEVCNFPRMDDIKFAPEKYDNQNPSCYVGGLTEMRGIFEISEATQVAGQTLILCGEFFSKSMRKEILDKFDNIDYRGQVDRKEISKILANSSIGFVTLLGAPNDYYAYPIKMFEYMAAGIPVIASNFPLYKKIVEGNSCGICVNPTNVAEIVDAIKRIQSDAEYAKSLGSQGRKAIEEKYSWEQQIPSLMECYGAVIAS
jgi:glycosyltransferase involved in cell wall biosynthesis